MKPEKILTKHAPAPIGPYSQAMKLDKFIYTAGQIPIDPVTGSIPEGIQAQTEQSIKNLEQILIAAGSSLNNVVKTTVFLKDMNEFAAMNEVYGRFFSVSSPARSTVEVSRLPRDVRVEIEAVAVVG